MDTSRAMSRTAALAVGSLAALAALPAAAHAAVWLQPPGACYVSVGPQPVQREVIPFVASGFTKNAPVSVFVDGVPADVTGDGKPDPLYADATGTVNVRVRAPYQPTGERPFTITITDSKRPDLQVSATPQVTALALALKPSQAPPSKRVRFRGRGFTKPGAVWAHYVYRGKLRKTVRLVRHPTAPCGTFSVKHRQIPVVRPRTGKWTLQVDQQKAYAPQPQSVFVRLSITVQRVIRHK
jgi:hypothetical protein